LDSLDKDGEIALLNYGFVDLDPEATALELQPEDEANRYCIQLYHHTVETVDLAGKDVLEVGSGRGGGASYIARYRKPARMVGLDYSGKSVAAAQRQHKVPGLSFKHGNAEKLPFAEAAFDAVVNVESSHCYPYLDRFLSEVKRVLRPGGHLLLTDFRRQEHVSMFNKQLDACGLHLVRKQDISANVLEALDRDSARKEALIERKAAPHQREPIRNFAAVQGSAFYEEVKRGELRYWSFVFQKPEQTS
jgi:ubiquinone/menaquinone biosynthesis C-methylase UbiE